MATVRILKYGAGALEKLGGAWLANTYIGAVANVLVLGMKFYYCNAVTIILYHTTSLVSSPQSPRGNWGLDEATTLQEFARRNVHQFCHLLSLVKILYRSYQYSSLIGQFEIECLRLLSSDLQS